MRLNDWKKVLVVPGRPQETPDTLAEASSRQRPWQSVAVSKILHALRSRSPFVRVWTYLSLDSSSFLAELFLDDVQEAFGPFLQETYQEELERAAQGKAQQTQEAEAPKPWAPTWCGVPVERFYNSLRLYSRIRFEPLFDEFVSRYGCYPSGLMIGGQVAATIIHLQEQETGKRFLELSPTEQTEWLRFKYRGVGLSPTVDPASLDRITFLLPNEYTLKQASEEFQWLERQVLGEN